MRAVYMVSALAAYAGLEYMNHEDANIWWNKAFPFAIGAGGSLNAHTCVADFMVSSLRDFIYVSYDQVLPEKASLFFPL